MSNYSVSYDVRLTEYNGDQILERAKEAALRAGSEAADTLVFEIQARTPIGIPGVTIDSRRGPGDLMRSYHKERGSIADWFVTNTPKTYYGKFVEFGWTRRTARGERHIPAQPHVRPAVLAMKQQFDSIVAERMAPVFKE